MMLHLDCKSGKINNSELYRIKGGSVGKLWYNVGVGWASGIAAKKRFPGAFLNNSFMVTKN